MTSSSESPEPCLERAGFLFAHDCPRPASQRCTRCSKAICAEHGHLADKQVQCTGCFRTHLQGDTERKTPVPAASLRELPPLLLATYYYQGFGYYGRGAWGHELLHDPNDFTEADGMALRPPEEDKRPFEKDMQGS